MLERTPSLIITRNTITLSCGNNKEFNLVDRIGKIVFTQNICAMLQFSKASLYNLPVDQGIVITQPLNEHIVELISGDAP